jgi:dihydroorotase
MYDLVITNGRVIDPSQEIDGKFDVAITSGKISKIAENIPHSEATEIMDVTGSIVIAGMIDVHTHVYAGVNATGVVPDTGGIRAGVTTMVDAGSSGCDTYGGFPNYIIPNNKTEILPFLHICRTGLATTPDIIAETSIDLENTIRVVQESNGTIKGIKARMVSPALEIFGMEMPKLAKRAAREAGVKLMVHIGDTENRYDESVINKLLPILDEGDIVTHLFTANKGGIIDSAGKLVPEAKEAKERGVWLDTAHGRSNFSFDIGDKVLDQGLIPHCISTDLTVPGRVNTVHSMTEMMTRFLAMGFKLNEVITMCTLNPAKAIGVSDRLGSLHIGKQADLSILKIETGDWVVYDVLRNPRQIDQAITPVACVKEGVKYTADWGPRSWGWLPDSTS